MGSVSTSNYVGSYPVGTSSSYVGSVGTTSSYVGSLSMGMTSPSNEWIGTVYNRQFIGSIYGNSYGTPVASGYGTTGGYVGSIGYGGSTGSFGYPQYTGYHTTYYPQYMGPVPQPTQQYRPPMFVPNGGSSSVKQECSCDGGCAKRGNNVCCADYTTACNL